MQDNAKIDPAHMQDILNYAKKQFLASYSYITEEEYDKMITEYFRENYTYEEVNAALPLKECCKAVQKAYAPKKYTVRFNIHGYIDVPVESRNPFSIEEIKKLATDKFESTDYGPVNIEFGDAVSIDDEICTLWEC